MTLAGLLGEKDVVEAMLKYVAATGRFSEKERREGGSGTQDEYAEQDRDTRIEEQGGNERNT